MFYKIRYADGMGPYYVYNPEFTENGIGGRFMTITMFKDGRKFERMPGFWWHPTKMGPHSSYSDVNLITNKRLIKQLEKRL